MSRIFFFSAPVLVYTLANADLDVALLDPVADRARLGMRYCTGGSIFQITDARHGPLLSGPTYPDAFNWRDGQGIPDAFSHRPLRAPGAASTHALVIGVGVCDLARQTVLDFCTWEADLRDNVLRMRTTQGAEGFALTLERTVTLAGRTVRSDTRIVNEGAGTLPVCWFPHPFFPQPKGDELCRISVPVAMPENPGYHVAPSGFIARRAWPGQDGFYQALDHQAHAPVAVAQRHDALGLIVGTCDYTPSLFPIWGNARTFSWEPFFERTLAPGQEAAWGIAYSF